MSPCCRARQVNATTSLSLGVISFADIQTAINFQTSPVATATTTAFISNTTTNTTNTTSGTSGVDSTYAAVQESVMTVAFQIQAVCIGGTGGFCSTASGFVNFDSDPTQRSASLHLAHAGGWKPLPFLTSPAFTSQLVLGPGTFVSLVRGNGVFLPLAPSPPRPLSFSLPRPQPLSPSPPLSSLMIRHPRCPVHHRGNLPPPRPNRWRPHSSWIQSLCFQESPTSQVVRSQRSRASSSISLSCGQPVHPPMPRSPTRSVPMAASSWAIQTILRGQLATLP